MSSTQTTLGRLRTSCLSVRMHSMMQKIDALSTASTKSTRGTGDSSRSPTQDLRPISVRSSSGSRRAAGYSPAYEWKPVKKMFTPMKLNSIVA